MVEKIQNRKPAGVFPPGTSPTSGCDFDRRHFLGGAALVGLAAAASGCAGLGAPGATVPPPAEPKSGGLGEPCLDVRNFGARGDGQTDDTAAIQKAVTSACARGNKLIFPAGRFMVSSPVKADFAGRGVWLAGAGQDVTFLVTHQPEAAIFSFSGKVLTLSDMTLMSINAPAKNIMVEGGEGVANKLSAINIGANVTGVMVNHFFGGAGFGGSGRDYGNNYGILIGKGCENYQIANCHLLGNRSGAILDHSSATAANRIVVNNMV